MGVSMGVNMHVTMVMDIGVNMEVKKGVNTKHVDSMN